VANEDRLEPYRRTFKQGQDLATEGELAESFFILIEGMVGIYREGKRIADISEPGVYIGEMAALLHQPRNATMKAETNVTCYAMPSASLGKVVEACPQVMLKLIRTLAQRLDETDRRLSTALRRRQKRQNGRAA
jgi:type IV pilus assembly protein PilB